MGLARDLTSFLPGRSWKSDSSPPAIGGSCWMDFPGQGTALYYLCIWRAQVLSHLLLCALVHVTPPAWMRSTYFWNVPLLQRTTGVPAPPYMFPEKAARKDAFHPSPIAVITLHMHLALGDIPVSSYPVCCLVSFSHDFHGVSLVWPARL